MDSRPTTAESKHNFQSASWSRLSPSATTPRLPSSVPLPETPVSPAAAAPVATPLDLIPILFPQHPSIYQAQLLNYNKLISPSRGGGVGLQAQPLPPVLSAPFVQASAPRSRSSSKSHHNHQQQQQQQPQQPQQQQQQQAPQSHSQTNQNCHGSKVNKNADKSDRSVTKMGKETAAQKSSAPLKQQPLSQASQSSQGNQPNQPNQQAGQGHQNQQTGSADHLSTSRLVAASSSRPQHHRPSKSPRPHTKAPLTQASSVPSTPHQHARNFSFESREPSPNATQNHSPRSAYSETNSTLPSLRPLPPRYGGCIYETALVRSRRRMPYSLGIDRLETVALDKIKSRPSEDDERTLTTDIRELYDRLRPDEKKQDKREKFVSKLETIFNEEWPGHGIRVHIFGSSGNRLCSDDSDVDICITTDWKEMENVCMIAELLAKRGMEKVVCVSSAKVPIVKIWDPELNLACDMNVNNTLALENTRMVLTYVNIDERVRPLAMIIKYWTRRRIINDAAFGGTLSSYTWICMVICFLQLRKVPILPSIHQRPEDKLPRSDGKVSEFADDMTKLRGFGEPNKETLGELLFHFFRFYAYEFDYDKSVLSVRLGKLTTKTEKKWHTTLNNMLCVEEPFNTVRNLGNTADDTSFRGLHMELRRAFDLISEAKLAECCEEYVFPKEEERVFQKPAQVPRPILLRSSSQQHSSTRGGGRGGSFRGNRQYRSGNNSRRASSSVAYENNPLYIQATAMMPAVTPQELQWYHQQQQVHQQVQQQVQQQAAAVAAAAAAAQHGGQQQPQQNASQTSQQQQQQQQQQAAQPHYVFHPDMLSSTLNALQIQQAEQSLLRYQLYTSPQAYVQQQHALAHAQRIQQTGTSSATDRSRTNSFDNPPLTAPIRPELYMYAMPPLPTPYFAMQPAGFTTPSSPSTATAPSEFRRSLHRTGPTSDASSPTGTLRSQSQPASRPSLPGSQSHGSLVGAAQINGSGLASYARANANGIPIPSFIRDENADAEVDTTLGKTVSDSHSSEEEGPRYIGYYVNDVPTSDATIASSPSSATTNGIPSFGDLGPSSAGSGSSGGTMNRRRLSTDQLPQTILDRRMRRTSRSPSPLGHSRAFSVGTNTAPLPSGPFLPVTGNRQVKESNRSPLVVNGSAMKPTSPNVLPNFQNTPNLPNGTSASSRHPSTSESVVSEESANSSVPNSYASHGLGISGAGILPDQMLATSPIPQPLLTPPAVELSGPPLVQSPVIVNGSTSSSVSSPSHAYSHANAQVSPMAPGTQSFGQRIAAMNGFSPVPYAAIAGHGLVDGMPQMSSPRQRNLSRQQQKGIAPLDLAMPDHTLMSPETQHLSPVYENRTPSPTTLRKLDSHLGRSSNHTDKFAVASPSSPIAYGSHGKNIRKDATPKSSSTSKGSPEVSSLVKQGSSPTSIPAAFAVHHQHRVNGTSAASGIANGHVRGAKSESGDLAGASVLSPAPASANGWQKPKSRKKAADLKAIANGHAHGEQLPKNESERKGG